MKEKIPTENIPVHVALLMDGNRRWAKKNKLPKLEGHRRSANNLDEIMTHAKKLGISYLTLWAFSTENWRRDKKEVDYLFDLLREFSKKYKKKFLAEKNRFKHIGRKDRIPSDVKAIIEDFEESTKEFESFTVIIAVDYGGRNDIVRAIKDLNNSGKKVTENNISDFLDTKGIPDPDLIIRTGGEIRLSGFMAWQATYSELYFTDTLFPEFGPKELEKAIKDFSKRKRNFGGN